MSVRKYEAFSVAIPRERTVSCEHSNSFTEAFCSMSCSIASFLFFPFTSGAGFNMEGNYTG